MQSARALLFVSIASALFGCGENAPAIDGGASIDLDAAGSDAAMIDAAMIDAAGLDGGPPSDAATDDAEIDGSIEIDGGVASARWLAGVSLASAEFAPGEIPGTYDTHYTYPTTANADAFLDAGMTVIRVPFLWSRLQRSLRGALDATELARLETLVRHITSRGGHAILDPHDYARYHGDVIGTAALPNDALADLWTRLATRFGDDERVIFGLMNEPNTMPTEQWLGAANAAIAAIRTAGATNLILVPGNAWTGGHSWTQSWYGTPNATVMGGIVDPMDHFAYEIHQYLDGDSSGVSFDCVSGTIGSTRLAEVTAWMRAQGARAFLGEVGGGANATCMAAVEDTLSYLETNDDVWMGFAWWAAGPWWGDYGFSLEPRGGSAAPQLAWLTPHFDAP